jgi:hypothetical protein
MFTLVNLESATLLSERFTLEDGRRAARAARLLSRKTGQRFQPRKIESVAVDTSWHDREIERFNTGEYLPLCDELTCASQIYETAHNLNLFAHVAKKNPALIAYTKDAQKGAQDKQSLLSIESFVKMVCVNNNAELQALIIDLQTRYAKANAPQQFKLATTPDDIERVYTNYARDSRAVSVSCMRYGHDETNWPKVDSKPFHPVRVYGAGDLAIAYLTDSAGKTTARTLVWPEHKIYSRMYADNDALHNALKEAGYSKSSYYGTSKSLCGARLLLVESDHGDYIAPYLDEIGNALLSDNDLIIDAEGDYICQSTNGTAEQKQEGECCEHCGDSYDEEDMGTVYTDSRQRGGETWCRHCRDSDAFYCEGTEEYYSDNVDYGVINDETYTQRYIDNNARYCEYYEEYTFGDLVTVIVDNGGETQEWSDNAVSDHAYKYDGDYYSNDVYSVRVITERYVLKGGNIQTDPSSNRWIITNCWYVDKVAEIPEYLIDDESVIVFEHDGKRYLKGYVDHYPVARERYDVAATPLFDALVNEIESIAA